MQYEIESITFTTYHLAIVDPYSIVTKILLEFVYVKETCCKVFTAAISLRTLALALLVLFFST
jgi:hypothetical protein